MRLIFLCAMWNPRMLALRKNEVAAAHMHGLAGDEAAARSAQKAHDGGDLLGFAAASERDRHFVRPHTAMGGPLGVDAAGRYAVNTDAVRSKFFRQRARESDEPGLGRRVVRFAIAAHE